MRRFLITSPKVIGTAEIWYNFEGVLCKIDLLHTNMNFEQIKYLFTNLSPDIETFRGMLSASSLEIKEVAFEITVEDFLHEYPYSRNTHLVREWWPKATKKEQTRAFFAAIEYRNYCQRNAHWYKPKIAIGWLQKKEYLNDWKTM